MAWVSAISIHPQYHVSSLRDRTAKKKLSDPVNRENRLGSYRALEKLYHEGKIKHIGVSNFTARHLEDLLEHCTIVPHVHQFELHPRLVQQDILSLCANHHIQVQAYSSLGEGNLLQDPDIVVPDPSLSRAQVLLRWAIQHGWAVIPKSSSPQRVVANANVFSFELSKEVRISLGYVWRIALIWVFRSWHNWMSCIKQDNKSFAGIHAMCISFRIVIPPPSLYII